MGIVVYSLLWGNAGFIPSAVVQAGLGSGDRDGSRILLTGLRAGIRWPD